MREIACVYIPDFPLRVEMLRNRSLTGSPVAIVSDEERVLCASPEAKKAGVVPDMSARQAMALCRRLTVLPRDAMACREAWDSVLVALYGVSPAIESAEEGVAFLDVRGLPALKESPERMLAVIEGSVPARWRARVGMAGSKFVARVAARRAEPGAPRWIEPAESASFLAFQPLEWVPVSSEMQRRWRLLGLNLMGQFARLPQAAVAAQFGQAGLRAWSLCRGDDDEPLRPYRWPQTVTERVVFPQPVVTRDALLVACEQLATAMWRRPERKGRPVRRARLRAIPVEGASWERTLTLKQPTDDPRRLAFNLRTAVQQSSFSGAVEEMALDVLEFSDSPGVQGSLFQAHRDTRARVAEAVAELKARYGYSPVNRLVEVEPWSRLPERRLALVEYEP